jgi:hypothetical protein
MQINGKIGVNVLLRAVVIFVAASPVGAWAQEVFGTHNCAISAALVRSANGLSNGTIKPVFGSFAALRIAGVGARRALKPPEITSPFFNNIGQKSHPAFPV